MTTLQIILVLLIAAITGMGSVLDAFQTHRPLVACTLIGLVLGDVKTGIILGGTLEMMALGWMNIGAAMAPDTAMASVISTILVITANQSIGKGIAVAVALAAAGQVLTIFARTLTIGLQHRADKYAEEGNFRGIDLMHYVGLGIQALRVVIPTLIVALISVNSFQAMLNAIPTVITKGLQVGGGIVVIVGYAMIINMMGAKYLMPFFFLGFVFAAFTNFNLVAFGVLGLVAAIFYIQLHPKYSSTKQQPALALASTHHGSIDNDLDDDLDD
ncbi:PTS mannose/fructose/sorbose transporter subunit IIC [Bacillus sp. 03113]|uniref:PTS mannose/fructose/sorbose transporter subunit IIC n=1 Tax=Bacillus sp. 03113 TaxID=2578211 RepID=UPI001141B042|nr:PTS mannose/fructose/sorbose transporter subunit IIC [Bacillus sp. 03113]